MSDAGADVTQPIIRVPPEFGVCLDVVTEKASRCVLSEKSCQSGKEVYSPLYERRTNNDNNRLSCNFPHDVTIGRCTSSLDDKRCAPSSNSCGTKSSFYSITDPTCSLLEDTSTRMSITFPACSNLVDTNEWQCVLDNYDCLSGERFNYAKWTTDWADKPCHCEDVPTGVCYQPPKSVSTSTTTETNTNTIPTNAMMLTPTNSFCAVTPRDCPTTTHRWISARDFMELSSDRSSATFHCRLCNESSIKKEKQPQQQQQQQQKQPNSYLAAGACQDDKKTTSSFVLCAMESTDCPDSTTFISSQKLYEQGLSCPITLTRNWGECTSTGDQVECTNKAESCNYDFRFERQQQNCNIYQNTETNIPTYFSSCSPRTDNNDRDWKDIRCVWDQSECDKSTERWEEAQLPNNAWFNGCLCEDVFTGVCKEDPSITTTSTTTTTSSSSSGGGEEEKEHYQYYCAVSAKGCTDPSSYIPQRLLAKNNINISCPLCPSSPSRSRSPSMTTSSSSPPVSSAPMKSVGSLRPSFSPSLSPITISPPLTYDAPSQLPVTDKEQTIAEEYYGSGFDVISGNGSGNNSDELQVLLPAGAIAGIIIVVVIIIILVVIAFVTGGSASCRAAWDRAVINSSSTSTVAERGQQEESNRNNTTKQQHQQSPPPDHDEELTVHHSSATIT